MVHGLTRVRGFTQDDAHIYCTVEQMQGEIRSLLQFVLDLLRDYGLDDFYLELSTRDPEKSIGSDEDWERATDALREAAEASGLELVLDPGGAAFYAPKISVQAKDAIGRTWQMSTIQVDLMLPDRFDLELHRRRRLPAAPGHDPPRAVRVDRAVLRRAHRALRGRVPGLARAGAGGRDPGDAASRSTTSRASPRRCAAQGVRVEVDAGDDRMQKKIRTHTLQKVPFLLLAGARDVEAGAVSFRFRDGTQLNGVPVDDGRRDAGRLGAAAGEHLADAEAFPRAGRVRRRPPRIGRVTGSGTWWTRWGLRRRRSLGGRRGDRTRVGTGEPVLEIRDGVGAPDRFRRLWTPHRLAYIISATSEAEQGCPFCRIPTLPDDDGLVRRPRRDGVRGAEPAPVQPRAPHGGALPARGGAGRPRRRRVGGADDRDPHRAAGAADGRPRRTRSTWA